MGKKLLLLFLSGMIGLMFLPGGLALWQKDVEIRGNVHTGNWNCHKNDIDTCDGSVIDSAAETAVIQQQQPKTGTTDTVNPGSKDIAGQSPPEPGKNSDAPSINNAETSTAQQPPFQEKELNISVAPNSNPDTISYEKTFEQAAPAGAPGFVQHESDHIDGK